jgi:Tol biopolymer transport system component
VLAASALALATAPGAAPSRVAPAGELGERFGRLIPATPRQSREPDSEPMWSLDGRNVAFRRETTVQAVPAAGGEARMLVRRGSVTWLPEDRIGVNSMLDVSVMNADGSGSKWVARGEVPAWSPDGGKVVVSRYYANRDTTKLFVVDVRSLASRPIPQPNCRCAVDDELPVWSADGKRLVFTRFVDALPDFQTFELDVVDWDGTNLRRLATHEVESAAWSPRGDLVAGYSWDDSGPVVNVITVADGSAVRIGRGLSPSWSPDGELVAFRGSDGAYVARRDGAKVWRLAGPSRPTCPSELSPCRSPDWLPDGKRLLWASADAIIVSSTDGRKGTTIAHGTDPALSPDGNLVVFAQPRCGDDQGIYVVRSNGADLRRLSGHCTIRATPLPERIVGTSADDTIYALDGKRDEVDCRPGIDRVIADKVDDLDGCELIRIR